MSVKKLSVFFKPASMVDTLTMTLKSSPVVAHPLVDLHQARFVADNCLSDRSSPSDDHSAVNPHAAVTASNLNTGIGAHVSQHRHEAEDAAPPHPDILYILGAIQNRKTRRPSHDATERDG